MPDLLFRPCTAFQGTRRIARGPLIDVALAVKAAMDDSPAATSFLTFDDATGRVVDLDLRGSTADIVGRLTESARVADRRDRPLDRPDGGDGSATRGRGRPRLGVVAREVTLLPRHWEWLTQQPGGASQALRRLVDQARRADGGRGRERAAQTAAYTFLSAMAGDLPGFEEAIRALFAGDRDRFAALTLGWPPDVRSHAQALLADGMTRTDP
ncbi:MAG: DUF2239 family protein [Reyranellaceae bacterium]